MNNTQNFNNINNCLLNNNKISPFLMFSSDNNNESFKILSNRLENNKNGILKSLFLSNKNIVIINDKFVNMLLNNFNIKIKQQHYGYVRHVANEVYNEHHNQYYNDKIYEINRLNKIVLDKIIKNALLDLNEKLKYENDLNFNNIHNGLDITIPENVNITGTKYINTQDRLFDLYK